MQNNDRSITFRLPAGLYTAFASVTEDVSGRLRYLIERDLRERRRKRGRREVASGVLAEGAGHEHG